MTTVGNVLSNAETALARAGIDTPRLDAEVLLAAAMQTSRAGLLARLRDPLDEGARARFADLLARRERRQPAAQIVGGKEFWSLWFEVAPSTLVPRPETEVLVEEVLASLCDIAQPTVLDMGTGSGCIAVAITSERRDARVTAIDISADALAVARRNAEQHGVAERVGFVCADIRNFTSTRRFDLVASNPPYACRGEIEGLQPEVSRWEPRTALDGGDDGLDVVRLVLARAPRFLEPNGTLAVEIGAEQGEAALSLARAAGFDAGVRADYAGLPRVLLGKLR